MNKKTTERKHVIREVSRKTLHLIIGTSASILAYAGIISWVHIILATLAFTIFSLLHKRFEFKIADKVFARLDRNDIIPGFGAIMLGLGIGISFLIFPKDIALIAGICASVVDGISTIIATLQEKRGNKRNSFATLIGMIVAFAILTSFFTHIRIPVILTGIIVAGLVDLYYHRIWLIDDNLVIPLLSGSVSWIALLIMMSI